MGISTLAQYLAFAKAYPERFVHPSAGSFTALVGKGDIRKFEAYMAHVLEAKGLPGEWMQVGNAY